MSNKILTRLDGAVAATASGMTRRRLLRRAGGTALAMSFGTAFAWQRPDLAHAGQIACGGYPNCRDTRCYSNGTCHNTSASRRQYYASGTCAPYQGGISCWNEQHGCLWRCCDCCVDYNTGSIACSGCGGSRWACLCRGIISC